MNKNKYNSIASLLIEWKNRYEEYKSNSNDFHLNNCHNESCILFGRQVEVAICLDELTYFINDLREQPHASLVEKFSLKEKCLVDDQNQGDN